MIESGIIMLWYGGVGNVPAGWHNCDGTNGTPNLMDRFIVGAGNVFPPGSQSGSLTHTHNFTAVTHKHELEAGNDIAAGIGKNAETTSKQVTGTTDIQLSLPPFHALCYIMKL